MNEVIIGLGSNIDPENNIRLAIEILSEKTELIKVSRIVKTRPVGYTDQDDFLNGAALINTYYCYGELVTVLKNTEAKLGRRRGPNIHGPRTIDLDILVWNGKVVDQDVYTRGFLRDSITELIADFSFQN